MKRYRKKIFISFFIIFLIFSIIITIVQQYRETKFKTKILQEKLESYTDIVNNIIVNKLPLDNLKTILPKDVRITLIDNNLNAYYDNVVTNFAENQNHNNRPEIIDATKKQIGSSIRKSASNNQQYLYLAKKIDKYYIRVALPYDIEINSYIKAGKAFIYIIISLFIVILLIINYVSLSISKSIQKLKDFSENNTKSSLTKFPDDELGYIGSKIVEDYIVLEKTTKAITSDREKLLQHIQISGEGICFFSKEKNVEFYNGLFIQYLNFINSESNSNPTIIFTSKLFKDVKEFIDDQLKNNDFLETKIEIQGKIFSVITNIFENRSFEIIINDITKEEKISILKQEITGNLAHELKTPITGIRGCLETVMENESLDKSQRQYFIERAYNKTIILSELVKNINLINKIDESRNSFTIEDVDINKIVNKVNEDFEIQLKSKNIKTIYNLKENIIIKGNSNLLYSIFRNLIENAIIYGGNEIIIEINMYNEDDNSYYFSFLDNGVGVDKKHLNRLFERFYRIDDGRTRDMGGTGLGLSIVKNAIIFHKGTIDVRNRKEGGLEFLFSLSKKF